MQVAVFAAENNHLHLLKINVYYSLLAVALQPVGFAGKIDHKRATSAQNVSECLTILRSDEMKKFSLRPCRKCGSPATIEYVSEVQFRITCSNSHCTENPVHYTTENAYSKLAAIRYWNRTKR